MILVKLTYWVPITNWITFWWTIIPLTQIRRPLFQADVMMRKSSMGIKPVLKGLIFLIWLILKVLILKGLATNTIDMILFISTIHDLLVSSYHTQIKNTKLCQPINLCYMWVLINESEDGNCTFAKNLKRRSRRSRLWTLKSKVTLKGWPN